MVVTCREMVAQRLWAGRPRSNAERRGSPILQIQNLQGSIVGTASLSETATGLLTKGEGTEYGVPRTSSPPKYSWQGGSALRTELPSGVIAMGARSYVPQIGRRRAKKPKKKPEKPRNKRPKKRPKQPLKPTRGVAKKAGKAKPAKSTRISPCCTSIKVLVARNRKAKRNTKKKSNRTNTASPAKYNPKNGYCEKRPEEKQRPDLPIPPPSVIKEGEKDVEGIVGDCIDSGLCDI